LRRHIEQWQWTQNRVGGSTWKRTAPHRQAPLTAAGATGASEWGTIAGPF
jgi:hypothetical protein